MIDIYVQRTRARACSDAPITSGSVGLVARFRFSEEWDELNKIAIFETDNYKEPVEIPEAGEVTVPDSVLVYPWTQLRVGVRGESEDGDVVIPTVYADCGTISLGANMTPVGTPPTPSQAEYLQAQIDELRESGIGGGITEETDPTVPAWAKAPEKPSYTAAEVGALPVGTEIPVVPTKVSAFENDRGYLTEQNLSGYAKSEDIPTKPSDIGAQPAGNYATKDEIPVVPAIPTTLPNPHKLTFSGAANAEYDGSEAVEVVIPQGGGGGFEQVANIELAESVQSVEFELSKPCNTVLIQILGPAGMHFTIADDGTETAVKSAVLGYINQDDTRIVWLTGNFQTAVSAMEQLITSLLHVSSAAILSCWGTTNNARSGYSQQVQMTQGKPGSAETINSIDIRPALSGVYIKAGTKVTVWGC